MAPDLSRGQGVVAMRFGTIGPVISQLATAQAWGTFLDATEATDLLARRLPDEFDVKWQPNRQVLRAIPGLELVQLPESTWCCGNAGAYNITQPEMSQTLLQRKIANIATTGAPIVASANPGCSVQLEAAVRDSNLKLKIAHPISLLAQAYRKSDGQG